MLLFVRKLYVDQIRAGQKQFEIRAGSKYSKVKPGDPLSINGQFQVFVTQVDHHTRESLIAAMPDWKEAIEACYPDNPGPYFVFHFKPPAAVPPGPAR